MSSGSACPPSSTPDYTAVHATICERCKKLALLMKESSTYHQWGIFQDLRPESCQTCAMIFAIRNSFRYQDEIAPSADETIVFLEHMPTSTFMKNVPRVFELLFYDEKSRTKWDFRYLVLEAYCRT